MKAKTAVQKLGEELLQENLLSTHQTKIILKMLADAEGTEKQQIIEAFAEGMVSSDDYFDSTNPTLPEHLNYYEQIYKNKKS